MNQLQQDRLIKEAQELVIKGPFGGVQTEMSPDLVEQIGFLTSKNIRYHDGCMSLRNGYNLANTPSVTAVRALADFYTANGTRRQAMISNTLYNQDGTILVPNFTAVAGAFAASSNPASWTVVNNKLLFDQGIDQVMLWAGDPAVAYAAAGATAPIASFLAELKTYCLAGCVVVGGVLNPVRFMWSLPGDPTIWGAGAPAGTGTVDLLDDLGPIRGIGKLYENGYIIRANGLTQAIPTGNGLKPFDLIPLGSRGKGTRFSYSIAFYGEEEAVWVGDEDIWHFNGQSFESIGSFPISGSGSRMGARTAIYTDLAGSTVNTVTGFISAAFGGSAYKAYWLTIRNANFNGIWVFNFYEKNWTRFNYTTNGITEFKPTLVGNFYGGTGVATTFDSLALGFSTGETGVTDPAINSFNGETAGSITGQITCNDTRHLKRINRVRIKYTNPGAEVDLSLTFVNERAETVNNQLACTTTAQNSNTVKIFNLNGATVGGKVTIGFSGLFISYTLSIAAQVNSNFKIFEITFLYETLGEYKNIA